MPQLGDEYLIPGHVSMYLENNDAPHDIDMAYISETLRDISQSIEKADEDEKELTRALETLLKRRATLLETQSKLRSIISPLRRFPAEILSEIFQHTIEKGYSVVNTSDSPWSLSHVSRHWRATALTCSGALWSSLYIGIYKDRLLQKDPLSLLRTCLARSRRHNISVCFDYPERVRDFKDKAKEIAQLLIDNCERWQSLEISHQCLEIHSLLGKARGRVPNLKNLVIRRGPVRTSPITAFELAPQLRTVQIRGGIDVVLGPGNPSLISYEDYRMSLLRDCLDSYFSILRSCRQHLQTFTSLHVSTAQRSRAENPPIILPQLKHFRGSHADLIQSVTTPNLETFHLDNSHFVLANSLLNVRDLFIRSRCLGVSKLTVSNIMITSHLLDILPLVPALAVLRFQFLYWGDRNAEDDIFRNLFQQMAAVDEVGTPKVVPNLREFSFTINPPPPKEGAAFHPRFML